MYVYTLAMNEQWREKHDNKLFEWYTLLKKGRNDDNEVTHKINDYGDDYGNGWCSVQNRRVAAIDVYANKISPSTHTHTHTHCVLSQ